MPVNVAPLARLTEADVPNEALPYMHVRRARVAEVPARLAQLLDDDLLGQALSGGRDRAIEIFADPTQRKSVTATIMAAM